MRSISFAPSFLPSFLSLGHRVAHYPGGPSLALQFKLYRKFQGIVALVSVEDRLWKRLKGRCLCSALVAFTFLFWTTITVSTTIEMVTTNKSLAGENEKLKKPVRNLKRIREENEKKKRLTESRKYPARSAQESLHCRLADQFERFFRKKGKT